MLRNAFGYAAGFLLAVVTFAPSVAGLFDITAVFKRLGTVLDSIPDLKPDSDIHAVKDSVQRVVDRISEAVKDRPAVGE